MKALIIEDDLEIVESVSLVIQMRWPEAQLVSTNMGRKGIELAQSENPDIIMLNLDLPDMSGFEVLKQVRLFSPVPIIILTAKAEEADMRMALECGADDYVINPCFPIDIIARVEAIVRKENNSIQD